MAHPAMTAALAILCYHRLVADNELATAWPYLERGTAVRVATFRAQLDELASFADVLSEPEALEALAGRRSLARPGVWLTFDDGYRDVLRIAHEVTGTAFVTTCAAERGLAADAWYAVLLGARRHRGELDLGVGRFAFDLRSPTGRARLVNGPERRRYLRASAEARTTTLAALAEQLQAPVVSPRCYLTRDNLLGLLQAGWSLGAHGVTHTPFDALPPAAALAEARQSRAALMELGASVRSLALPDGSAPEDTAALATAGFECVLELGNTLGRRGGLLQGRFLVPDDPRWAGATLRPRFA